MITANVAFCGEDLEPHGFGVLRHQYLVVAQGPWPAVPTNGSGMATVVKINDAPLPYGPYPARFVVFNGGERAAFDRAIAALRCLPGNISLDLFVFEDPATDSGRDRPKGHSFG